MSESKPTHWTLYKIIPRWLITIGILGMIYATWQITRLDICREAMREHHTQIGDSLPECQWKFLSPMVSK